MSDLIEQFVPHAPLDGAPMTGNASLYFKHSNKNKETGCLVYRKIVLQNKLPNSENIVYCSPFRSRMKYNYNMRSSPLAQRIAHQ